MTELHLTSADAARALLADFPAVGSETAALAEADGRVLAAPFHAPEPLPTLPRSVMDGYAVRSADLAGASEAVPGWLAVVGHVPMGAVLGRPIGPGEAAGISTGGVLPEGADAVVMLEYSSPPRDGEVAIVRAAQPGEHVLPPGGDAAAGALLLPAGRRLRPQDVGLLAAFGRLDIPVFRQPRVAILSTGNEVVPPDAHPAPGQVRDINSVALAAKVRRAGCQVTLAGITRDDAAALEARLAALLAGHDAVLLSGGSSVGVRDLAAEVVGRLGAPGVLCHGISVRPGKPTLVARVGDKPVIALPGVPVSALVIFDAFVRPLLWRLGGEPVREPWPVRRAARLTAACRSVPGREDYVRVRLTAGGDAEPLAGGSAAVSSLVSADGYLVIPAGSPGHHAGDAVELYLFE